MKKLMVVLLVALLVLTGCSRQGEAVTSSFFAKKYSESFDETALYKAQSKTDLDFSQKLLYEDLCYEENDVIPQNSYDFKAMSAACYDVDNAKVIYSEHVYEKVYPASTTKLLTALMAVKYSNMDSVITIKEDNCGITTWGASLSGLLKGDRITMQDLLYCLLVHSGNDAAVAIAEEISGSEDEFCRLMNEEARLIGCNDTKFVNSHGLHNLNHYTTAYDMYLIFNECLKYPQLKEIFSTPGYDVTVTRSNGDIYKLYMEPTNLYFMGDYKAPEGITVVGGKTGSTNAAGYCLIIYSTNSEGHGYITEIFNAANKEVLYNEMNELLKMCK